MQPTLVQSLLDDLLDVSVASLTDPPARQYVAHGSTFAFDCELVAVTMARMSLDRPRGEGGCLVIPTVTLCAYVLRCYPSAGGDDPIPAAADIGAAALVLAGDAAALAGGIGDAWAAGTLFPTAGIGCARVDLNPGVEPLGPSGGLAGWRVMLTVRL